MECLTSGYGKQYVPEIGSSGYINVRDLFPQVYIVQYMDNILFAHKDEGVLLEKYGLLQQSIQG